MKVYLVISSSSLFGSFDWYNPNRYNGEEVMGRNPEEAVMRFKKRHHKYRISTDQTSEKWAHYRAILKEKPFERYTTYWD